MDDINVLKLPQSTIVNRVIPKEKLYSHGDVNYAIKRKFVEQVDKIIWSNKVAAQTLNISSGKYEEIEVLQVYLKNGQIDDKLLKIIDTVIPYLILFVLVDNGFYKLAMAYKADDKVGRYFETNWIDQPQFELIGNSVDQIYANILHNIDKKLRTDVMPLSDAINDYEHKIEVQKQIDKLTKQIAREPSSAKRQKLAKERAELGDLHEN